MKLLAICGFGVGSSLMLKISIEKVCKELEIAATVVNGDIASAKGTTCDAIFTSGALVDTLKQSVSCPVYGITNFIDKTEIKAVVSKFLEDKNL